MQGYRRVPGEGTRTPTPTATPVRNPRLVAAIESEQDLDFERVALFDDGRLVLIQRYRGRGIPRYKQLAASEVDVVRRVVREALVVRPRAALPSERSVADQQGRRLRLEVAREDGSVWMFASEDMTQIPLAVGPGPGGDGGPALAVLPDRPEGDGLGPVWREDGEISCSTGSTRSGTASCRDDTLRAEPRARGALGHRSPHAHRPRAAPVAFREPGAVAPDADAGEPVGDRMVRITAGRFRGRRLEVPRDVRPTTEMARKAVFDILGPAVVGARVLDACAGSGAYGLEALSRGAAHATFVEKERRPREVLERNIESLGVAALTRIEGRSVAAYAALAGGGLSPAPDSTSSSTTRPGTTPRSRTWRCSSGCSCRAAPSSTSGATTPSRLPGTRRRPTGGDTERRACCFSGRDGPGVGECLLVNSADRPGPRAARRGVLWLPSAACSRPSR